MKIRSFFPCEKVVGRKNKTTDILGYGPKGIKIKKKEDSQYGKATIEFFTDIYFELGEEGQKNIKVKFFGPDGELLAESSNLNVDVRRGGTGMNFGGPLTLKAKKEGDHVLKLLISESVKAEWPLKINIIED